MRRKRPIRHERAHLCSTIRKCKPYRPSSPTKSTTSPLPSFRQALARSFEIFVLRFTESHISQSKPRPSPIRLQEHFQIHLLIPWIFTGWVIQQDGRSLEPVPTARSSRPLTASDLRASART